MEVVSSVLSPSVPYFLTVCGSPNIFIDVMVLLLTPNTWLWTECSHKHSSGMPWQLIHLEQDNNERHNDGGNDDTTNTYTHTQLLNCFLKRKLVPNTMQS